MRIRRDLSLALAVLVLLGAALSSGARAAPLNYLSQTGNVRVIAYNLWLPAVSESIPISTLDDVDEELAVEAGDPELSPGTPPGYYFARAELHTTLTPTRLSYFADAEARFIGTSCCEAEFERAYGEANIGIRFELEQPIQILLTQTRTPGRFNGPSLQLRNLDLGFSLSAYDSGYSVDSCGTLSFEECTLLENVFSPDGTVLPAGEYELLASIYAWDPTGASCAEGCDDAGGSVTLQVIPEPAGFGLVGLGLAALTSLRRRAAARPPGP